MPQPLPHSFILSSVESNSFSFSRTHGNVSLTHPLPRSTHDINSPVDFVNNSGIAHTVTHSIHNVSLPNYPCNALREDIGEPNGCESSNIFIGEETTNMQIVKHFLCLGYPLSISAFAQFSINAVIVSVVGKLLGVEQLGGVTLALGLLNATGFAFGAGLCGALETLLSQTYGIWKRKTEQPIPPAHESATPTAPDQEIVQNSTTTIHSVSHSERSYAFNLYIYGTYTQRMIIILLVTAFPLGVIISFADKMLSGLGESAKTIYFMGRWCRIALFGIPFAMIYQLLQRYYSCQHITKPLSIAAIVSAIVNPGLQFFFVHFMGLDGSSVAWLVLMFGLVFGLWCYLRFTGLYRNTWCGWDDRSKKNIGSMVKLALPSMGVMISEWVALEINALMAGFAPANELATYSITIQVFGIMWGVASGVMLLACVFVGNAIGERKPLLARRIAFISIGLVFVLSLINICIVGALTPVIPKLFSDNEDVRRLYRKLIFLVLPYHIIDTFQSTVMGILRGCKLQKLGAFIITIAFCVVGVPLSFILFFCTSIGVVALWIGPFVGLLTVGLPSYVYILLCYIDWVNLKPHEETESARVEERVEDTANDETTQGDDGH